MLAQRSDRWALVRSLTHPSNDHSAGHQIMLSGRSQIPPGFNPSAPKPTDWPAIVSVAGAVTRSRNNLPPAVVLPEKLVHNSGRVIPGQFAGVMGRQRDPWFLEASAFEPKAYGAYPEYEFDHQERKYTPKRKQFTLPDLTLPEGVLADRFGTRLDLLKVVDQQRRRLDQSAGGLDRYRQAAVSLLTDARVRKAFDVHNAPPREIDRYGRNAFGWSLWMAARLVEAGVNLVQVNLGNNETWDTHGNAFPHLKDHLFPPTDRALSALLDDLDDRRLACEHDDRDGGRVRTDARVFRLPQFYSCRAATTGECRRCSSPAVGARARSSVRRTRRAYPATEPQTPENMAATIYDAAGRSDDDDVARRGEPAAPRLPRRADRWADGSHRYPTPQSCRSASRHAVTRCRLRAWPPADGTRVAAPTSNLRNRLSSFPGSAWERRNYLSKEEG
jgi:hypothetical protein